MGAEGIAGAFREPLHELFEQRFIGPRYHGRDEQALCLRLAFADATSTEPFEHQFQPSPTGVRRSPQKDVQVAETAGQESCNFAESCSGIDQNPAWRELAAYLSQQGDEGMRATVRLAPIVNSRELVDICLLKVPAGYTKISPPDAPASAYW